ncbi:uncharacterized protein LOC143019806 [Oratosquilla oratoria]|uniref:uncharacterized protein LOC143019806 n=1 Tax=Oratosquilla oratoria TaxID=337810 RepID=UPI003F75FA0A
MVTAKVEDVVQWAPFGCGGQKPISRLRLSTLALGAQTSRAGRSHRGRSSASPGVSSYSELPAPLSSGGDEVTSFRDSRATARRRGHPLQTPKVQQVPPTSTRSPSTSQVPLTSARLLPKFRVLRFISIRSSSASLVFKEVIMKNFTFAPLLMVLLMVSLADAGYGYRPQYRRPAVVCPDKTVYKVEGATETETETETKTETEKVTETVVKLKQHATKVIVSTKTDTEVSTMTKTVFVQKGCQQAGHSGGYQTAAWSW